MNESTTAVITDRYSAFETFSRYYMALLIILGTFGNVFCIVAYMTSDVKKYGSTRYLIALSTSDLGFVICMALTWIKAFDLYWQDLSGFCEISTYISGVCCFLSGWYVAALSGERCFAVCWPYLARRIITTRRTTSLIIVLALLGAAINAPLFYLAKSVPEGAGHEERLRRDNGELVIDIREYQGDRLITDPNIGVTSGADGNVIDQIIGDGYLTDKPVSEISNVQVINDGSTRDRLIRNETLEQLLTKNWAFEGQPMSGEAPTSQLISNETSKNTGEPPEDWLTARESSKDSLITNEAPAMSYVQPTEDARPTDQLSDNEAPLEQRTDDYTADQSKEAWKFNKIDPSAANLQLTGHSSPKSIDQRSEKSTASSFHVRHNLDDESSARVSQAVTAANTDPVFDDSAPYLSVGQTMTDQLIAAEPITFHCGVDPSTETMYRAFTTVDTVVSFSIPLVITLILNIAIAYRVCRAARERRALTSPSGSSLGRTKSYSFGGRSSGKQNNDANGDLLLKAPSAIITRHGSLLCEYGNRRNALTAAMQSAVVKTRLTKSGGLMNRKVLERRITSVLVAKCVAYLILNLPSYLHRVLLAFETPVGEQEMHSNETSTATGESATASVVSNRLLEMFAYLLFYTQFSTNFLLYSFNACVNGAVRLRKDSTRKSISNGHPV